MDISKYVKSILPGFEKDRVTEDIRVTRSEIKDVLVPAYAGADKAMKSWKFRSEAMGLRIETWNSLVKFGGSANIVCTINKGIPLMLENLDGIESLINRTYSEDVMATGLTYLKAQMLQFVECLVFVSKYARRFLNYVYVYETSMLEGFSGDVADSLSPAEIQWIEANFVNFCTAFNIVVGEPHKVEAALKDIPDIVITDENAKTIPATMGIGKVDPFQMRFIPVILNPFYHIGIRVAEWQAKRYKAAQEELRLLQLRKLNMERLQQNKPDVKLTKEIQYLESRIQGLNYDIAKMEKEYA